MIQVPLFSFILQVLDEQGYLHTVCVILHFEMGVVGFLNFIKCHLREHPYKSMAAEFSLTAWTTVL